MSESNKKYDIELTDAAWARLQQKLSGEQEAPQWSRWSAQLTAASVMEHASGELAAEPAGLPTTADNMSAKLSAEPDSRGGKRERSAVNQWFRKRTKWVAAAAAASIVAVTIATPAGNQALASILNKFRMQQLTVVQENDLEAILNGAFGDGLEHESINSFGTFSHQSGKTEGPTDLAGASKALGHQIVVPKEFAEDKKIHVSPSSSLTFKMNVNEVNRVMKRLGANKLLPQSVDGKPITLEMGASTHLYIKSNADAKDEKGYSLSQMPAPVITVDPSIPMAEALDALMQFPALPESIKQNLQTANVLQGGSVPLPLVENGQTDKVKVDGIEVIVSTTTYGDGKFARHAATWVKNGQLFRLNGDTALTDRQAVLNKVSELIKS